MIPKQIATIVNTMAAETVGATAVVQEDLSNIVEVGQTITNAIGYDSFTNSLVDRIGRVIAVNREYESAAPDILRRGTGIPYGSITQKIRVKLPSATVNDSWAVGQTWTPGQGWTVNDLPTNDNVSPFITVRPECEATYFNGAATFEIDMTFPTIQIHSAFSSPEQMRTFVDTIENRIYQARTVFKDALTQRAINNLVAQKLVANNAIIDLVSMYNIEYGKSLYNEQAVLDRDFLRYAGYIISLYTKRLRRMSRLYNTAGYDTFTPTDRLRFVTLDMFTDAIETFMTADTFHDNMVGLKDAYYPINYWQGGGNDAEVDFGSAASLNVLTAAGDVLNSKTGQAGGESAPAENHPFYIVGAMFDVEACWQEFDNPRVTSQYNPRKEQTTYFYKEDVRYCNDLAENCVVFTFGTPTYPAPETKTKTRKS